MSDTTGDRLGPLLDRAQRLGFLGPGAIADAVEHARAFAALLGPPPASFLDLGSGGGLPGLVLALRWPSARGVLLESGRRRGEHLEEARRELGLTDRVTVLIARAEEAAREPQWRGAFELVVARGFGAPAATAECAVGFLRPGGRLVVSEPPGGGDPKRWDRDGLDRLGLSGPEVSTGGGATAAAFLLAAPADARWPRRTGVPAHRPLWR